MKTSDIKPRTLTFTVEYTPRYYGGGITNFDQSTKIMAKVVEAIQQYNANKNSDYSKANITGIWLEPEELDIDEQNKLLDDIKNS